MKKQTLVPGIFTLHIFYAVNIYKESEIHLDEIRVYEFTYNFFTGTGCPAPA